MIRRVCRQSPPPAVSTSPNFYGEVELPLLADARFGDLVDISAAARYFDYSTFDRGVTGKIGLRWRPVETLLFRGAWAEGFRAPSIGELFGGRTRLDAAIADPCAGFLTTSVGQPVIDNCTAAGVPRDGSYTQLGGQISVLTGGNALLDPETSRSLTFALAWQPAWAMALNWVGDLRFEANRHRHKVDDAITGYDAQAVLDGCYRNGVAALCDLVDRNQRGGISRFRNTLFNVGSIRTDGWDFAIVYASPFRWRAH